MAELIDGKALAAEVEAHVTAGVRVLAREHGIVPGLAVVLVGEDPASEVYVGRKIKQTHKVGMRSFEHRLGATTGEDELLLLIERLNRNPEVHGILVQLPLPKQIDSTRVLEAIDPAKDVDGFHPVNVGRLSSGMDGFTPCTPLGCIGLLERVVEDFRGLHAVVIGRSNIVGKPVSTMLLARGCTVTMTHSLTRDLRRIVRGADIVVVAVGRAQLVRGDWVKPGAIVIDVGINRVTNEDGTAQLVGDAAFDELAHARAVTPVPGGVGPMTIACLLGNTLHAAQRREELVRNVA